MPRLRLGESICIGDIVWFGAEGFICRKISKRIDDLLRESAALRESVIPQLTSLADAVTKAVDFGIQVCFNELHYPQSL